MTCTKTSEWQGGFGASVSITNTGDAITGWTLEWTYASGQVPVLAPITWTSDGWPRVTTVNGGWGVNYPMPNLPAHHARSNP